LPAKTISFFSNPFGLIPTCFVHHFHRHQYTAKPSKQKSKSNMSLLLSIACNHAQVMRSKAFGYPLIMLTWCYKQVPSESSDSFPKDDKKHYCTRQEKKRMKKNNNHNKKIKNKLKKNN
jgi:hypothetical protein